MTHKLSSLSSTGDVQAEARHIVAELFDLEGHLEADEMDSNRNAWGADVVRRAMTVLRSLLAAQEAAPSARAERWQPIETAPKDGTRVDIWAKSWLPAFDRFESRRFPDCSWMKGDSMTNRKPYWLNLHEEWHPTHWMPLPSPPAQEGSPR